MIINGGLEMLEFVNVTGKDKKFALKDISFCAQPGFITGIIGKNGAGKSTLFKYIYDEKVQYDGAILYNGKNIREDFTHFQNEFAIISDERKFFQRFSARENVALLKAFYENWNDEIFKTVAKELDVPMNTSLSNLSRGQYIKFQLAYAAAHSTKLYLLDEATAGMDPVFRKEFFKYIHELIAQKEVTVIMTSHIEEDIKRHMDYIALLENRQLKIFEEVKA